MKLVPVSQITRDMIRANADPRVDFKGTAQLVNGQWHIPLSDDVIDRLEQHRMPGESLDDVIQRACSTLGGISRQ